MAKLREILAGQDPVTAAPSDTVREASKKMAEGNVGCVVITEEGKPLGVFTERDLLRRVMLANQHADEVAVHEVMTTDLIMLTGDDDAHRAQALMRKHHIRHMPIVDPAGKLLGVLSIRDLIREEVREMRDYITLMDG